jgi:predicted cupin superfamily sugar epimerase
LDADAVIAKLGLGPHPEGGHFRRTWRDDAGSAIYFLLREGERSTWHRLHGRTETWHFYSGDPIQLCLFDGDRLASLRLGDGLDVGQQPQVVVPAEVWQSAWSLGRWSLAGCTVAPPFSFTTLEIAPSGWEPPEPDPSGNGTPSV